MKRLALIASVLLMAASCAKSPVATLSGTAEGLGDTCLVLKRLDLNNLVPVDTIAPGKDGSFNCKVNLPGETPTFYYLFDGNWDGIAHPADRPVVNRPSVTVGTFSTPVDFRRS